MRREDELRKRLASLEEIAKQKQPDCKYDTVPIPEIKDDMLRGEIYTLVWALDLID